ncbi:MAG: EAL domain-containing protein [Sulfuricella sp.]|nr:EAL domain-containing protein [Sulfuricella sp.]
MMPDPPTAPDSARKAARTPWWSRLGFLARLAFITAFALAVAGGAMLYSSVKSDSAWHQANLATQAQTELESLAAVVAEQAVIGDYATIQQSLSARVRRDNIDSVRFADAGGAAIRAEMVEPARRSVPRWFRQLAAVDGGTFSHDILVGGRRYGTVTVQMSATPALDQTWAGFLSHLLILTLALGLNFLGILLTLKTGLRPLDALGQGARRLGGGDFSARIPPQGSTEMRATISTFNRMAQDIQGLLAQVHREKELAQVTLQSIGDAVITTDAGEWVTYLNPVAENLTGWSNAEAYGRPLTEVFRIINEFNREAVETPVDRVLREGVIVGLANHTVLIARDGREYAIEDSAAPIRDRDDEILGVVMVFHDVTEKREMAREMSWQASHDPLTGLANRREFERRLHQLLHTAKAGNQVHALIYMDLDQFKVVNDTCGHVAGDELLRQVTVLLQGKVRGSDTLARLGGDEFGVLLECCPVEKASRIAEEMIDMLKDFRFPWQDKTFMVGASIGVSAISVASTDIHGILSAADTACYIAKERGRNRVQVYSAEDAELASRHGEMHWVSRISDAIEQDAFCLHFQRISPLHRNGREHLEILVRMNGAGGEGLILPGAFIPAAERFGLMPAVDRWVVSAALSAYRRRLELGVDGETWAINLSGASLGDPAFLHFVAGEFERHTPPRGAICFEITETAAIGNLPRVAAFIREMKGSGCSFALDDFGSGLSSFAYLQNLAVDYLKIDGRFVKNMTSNASDFAIVESVNRIGHALGIETIAEFVENEEILTRLRSIGVDYAQGYHVHKPQPLDDLLESSKLAFGG